MGGGLPSAAIEPTPALRMQKTDFDVVPVGGRRPGEASQDSPCSAAEGAVRGQRRD